ncbi:MAG: family 43 glycosylhydrolase, partial [Spirochaetota bacterium]
YFDGRFYYYGTMYRHYNGFTQDNLIACYSSEDMETWVFEGTMTHKFPSGLTVAPDVKFNRNTGQYVMWLINSNNYVVATANRPIGPFTIATMRADIHFADDGNGDFALFIDEDGTGYLIATITKDTDEPTERHCIFIERLTDDYLGGTGEVSAKLAYNCEAPVMFRRNGAYYALFDTTCCYCPAGTGVQVHTATDPLGPYTYRGNVNRKGDEDPEGISSPSTEPGSGREDCIVPSQQRRIALWRTASGPLLVWIGDRWGSADDGLKGHDYTYIAPVRFAADGMPARFEWLDTWSAEFTGAVAHHAFEE